MLLLGHLVQALRLPRAGSHRQLPPASSWPDVHSSRRDRGLSAAWLAEAKAGLVQMLREDQPFETQSMAVLSMLAANAPPLPDAEECWWRGLYILRSSHQLAEALKAGEQPLRERSLVTVNVSAGEPAALSMQLPLSCGLALRLEGEVQVRVVGDAALLTVSFEAADFEPDAAGAAGGPSLAEALQECETDLRSRLPSADAPAALKLRERLPAHEPDTPPPRRPR